jgi:hypothetical protein
MQLFYRSKSHSVAKMLPSREDVRSMIDWVHTHSWIYLSVKSSWAVSPHPALAAYSLGSTHPGDPKPIPIQTRISSNPNPQTQEEMVPMVIPWSLVPSHFPIKLAINWGIQKSPENLPKSPIFGTSRMSPNRTSNANSSARDRPLWVDARHGPGPGSIL